MLTVRSMPPAAAVSRKGHLWQCAAGRGPNVQRAGGAEAATAQPGARAAAPARVAAMAGSGQHKQRIASSLQLDPWQLHAGCRCCVGALPSC